MKRRDLVSSIGVGFVSGLGGCASVLDEDSVVELLRVGAINWTDEAVEVQIRVDLDGDVVEEVTYELEPDEDGRILDCTWPSEPGNFGVAARLEGAEEWSERELTGRDADCVSLYVMIEPPSREISMPISTDCNPPGDRC